MNLLCRLGLHKYKRIRMLKVAPYFYYQVWEVCQRKDCSHVRYTMEYYE